MRNNRVVAAAILVGVVTCAVTFISAAKMSGEDSSGKEGTKTPASAPKSGARPVYVFGYVDIDNGVGLLPLFPESLPQPCKVLKVRYKEGDVVKKDDVVLELDKEFAEYIVDTAKAGVAQAEGLLQQAKAGLELANSTIAAHGFLIRTTEETVLAKGLLVQAAEAELKRNKERAERVGSSNDPDLAIASKKLESAQKDLDAERVKLEGMRKIQPTAKRGQAVGAVAEATAAVTKQKAELNKALYGLRLMSLKAPVDGKIIRSSVTEGMILGPQTKMPPFFLQPAGPMIIRAEVDQEWASRVAKDQNAVIQDDGNSSLNWKGKVIRVADSFLPKRSNSAFPEGLALNETRMLECIISVDDFDPKSPLRVGRTR